MKHIVKRSIIIVLIVTAIFMAAALTAGGFLLYQLNYRVHTVGKSQAPDGRHSLLLQSVGEPFLFGSAKGRLVLLEDNRKTAVYKFTISDDGGKVRADTWEVIWNELGAVVILSGSEQDNEWVEISYDGEIFSKRAGAMENERNTLPEEEPETGEQNPENREPDGEQETGQQAEYQRIMDGYRAVYNVCFKGQGKEFREDYDAKGNSRILLNETDSEIEYMVYDRTSRNEKCGLYVYYRVKKAADGTWSPMEAEILGMYAYVYDSGKVIDSGKKAWSDPGTEEYQEAAGEP